MTLPNLAADFFRAHPQLRFGFLAPRHHLEGLPDTVFGVPVERLAVEEHPVLPAQYLATNAFAFGPLALPRWVLSDLYLMPGGIGVLLCPASEVRPELREHLQIASDDRIIGAAYVAAPTLRPQHFVGVSLLCFLQHREGARWVKSLTLKLLAAQTLRGVAQWDNPSLRVHTRLGPLRLIGRPPGGHEYADRTFVYESVLTDEGAWAAAMGRQLPGGRVKRIPASELKTLNALVDRAERGEGIFIAPPGLEDGCVLIQED